MDHSIRTALGIKDTHFELDTNIKEESIADHGEYIVVHLVQSYHALPSLWPPNVQEWH